MLKSRPLVTVITATYNRANFLIQAVQSVFDQTYDNFEMIIVDDGSSDNTREILAPLLSDARLRYVYQNNQGQSVARNTALKQAAGDFICFLDSDDIWFPKKIETELEAMEQNQDVSVVFGDIVVIDEDGRELSRRNPPRYSGYVAHRMINDNFVSMSAAMARRQCFDEMGGMSGKRRVADDYDLWLRFSARYKFLYISEYLAKWRVMDGQISSDIRLRLEANEQIIRDFLTEFPDILTPRQRRESLSAFYARKGRLFAQLGGRREALLSILRAVIYSPFSMLVWRAFYRVLFSSGRSKMSASA